MNNLINFGAKIAVTGILEKYFYYGNIISILLKYYAALRWLPVT